MNICKCFNLCDLLSLFLKVIQIIFCQLKEIKYENQTLYMLTCIYKTTAFAKLIFFKQISFFL